MIAMFGLAKVWFQLFLSPTGPIPSWVKLKQWYIGLLRIFAPAESDKG